MGLKTLYEAAVAEVNRIEAEMRAEYESLKFHFDPPVAPTVPAEPVPVAPTVPAEPVAVAAQVEPVAPAEPITP